MNSDVVIVIAIIGVLIFMLVLCIPVNYFKTKDKEYNKEYDKATSENKELQEIQAEMDRLRENYNKGCFLREKIKKANEEAIYFPLNHCLSNIAKLKVEFLKVSNDYYRFEELRNKKYSIIREIERRIYK